MKIAQIAPLWIPVPPYNYGGTELVVSLLTEELVRRGHEVTLFASGDSRTKAHLVPIWPTSLWRAHLSVPHAAFGLMYKKIFEMQDQFDIIHDHCEFYTAPYSPFLKPPIVSTIHHPMYEEMVVLFKKFPNINYVAISKNQKKSAPGVNFVRTIYHGLPMEQYPFSDHPSDYLLWLSKITPQKGPAEAIEVAKKAGEKLILSGNLLREYRDYFEYRVKPLIDGRQIQFVGASNFSKKIELFKNAKAVLYPVKRQEPFGLVVVEAMACGTPVIAYKEGAMAEIIKDGETGFLVSNQEEMVQAVKKIGLIDRRKCREYAEKNFPLGRMVNRYERLYKKILRAKKNDNKKPTA